MTISVRSSAMLAAAFTTFGKPILTLSAELGGMGYFQPDKRNLLIERRAALRTRATCAASLQTLTSERFGYLWDLSETGARVSTESPPAVGESAVLKWGTEKVMCRVVWTDRDMCGLAFNTPIDLATVASSARMIGIVEQPVATVGNIPAGRKRSAPGTSPSREDEARPDLLATRFRNPGGWGSATAAVFCPDENRERKRALTQLEPGG